MWEVSFVSLASEKPVRPCGWSELALSPGVGWLLFLAAEQGELVKKSLTREGGSKFQG